MNARQFLDQIADTLRTKGRVVEVTVTEESFGTFVWLYAPAPNWYDRSISLSARKSRGRWALGELMVGPGVGEAKSFKRTTRTRIRIAADVYA